MNAAVKPVIYQLVVRTFGNTKGSRVCDGTLEENGCGKFDDINDAAIAGLRELGVTHIWLTGVLRQATLTDHCDVGLSADPPDIVKGRAGSLYCVTDYYDVCPDYATVKAARLLEFSALVKRVNAAGLRVLIDLVPNHVSRGYHSTVREGSEFGLHDDQTVFFARDNNYFYLMEQPGQSLRLTHDGRWAPKGVVFTGAFEGESGEVGHTPRVTGNNVRSTWPRATDWYDTVKLNYGWDFVEQKADFNPLPSTWKLVDGIIEYWQSLGVAGFRCDFAHYVPKEAWIYLIARARERDSDAYFMAEAYPWQGSGDPIERMEQLLDAGFNAVYHDASYDQLKRIYQGKASLGEYANTMEGPGEARGQYVQYLENHDERRIASPICADTGPEGTGFGSLEASFQLAPLQLLYSQGPVLVFNGQEVGEPGADEEGFSGQDGRTTIFDYWTMPELSKWVNDHQYDGGRLTPAQSKLRRFYARLGQLCQDPSIRGSGYWNLRDANSEAFCQQLYSFARFEPSSGRVVVVVANFMPGQSNTANIRLSRGLCCVVGINRQVVVRTLLDARRPDAQDSTKQTLTLEELQTRGFGVTIENQSSGVYAVEQEPDEAL
jgi:glycosidase